MKWIDSEKELPKKNQTVWAYDIKSGFIALACLVYDDGWLWAISNGVIYIEDGEIVSECELDDDYTFTHWIPLPNLPKNTG